MPWIHICIVCRSYNLLLFNESSTEVHELAMHYVVKRDVLTIFADCAKIAEIVILVGDLSYSSFQLSRIWRFYGNSQISQKSWVLVRTCPLIVTIYDLCDFSQSWQFSENVQKSRVLVRNCLHIFSVCDFSQNCQLLEKSQKSRVLVRTCLIFSVYDFCEFSQSWQFSEKSQISRVLVMTLSSYFHR